MGGAMPGTCFYIGNVTVYLMSPIVMGLIWIVSIAIGFGCAKLVGLARRFGSEMITIAVSTIFLGASMGLLIWTEYSCIREMAVPAKIEGGRIIDNDANIRGLFLLEGLITPLVLSIVLGTLGGWFRNSPFRPIKQHG